jgi:TPR repeat protein
MEKREFARFCVAALIAGLLSAALVLPTAGDDLSNLQDLERRAATGETEVQVRLGKHYFYGEAGDCDFGKAHRWLSLAAEAGNPVALYYLGSLYEHGYFVERDTALAREFYARSLPGLRTLAAEGDPEAMADLGLLYNTGLGIECKPESSVYWVTKAAEAGLPRAQYYTGFYYFHGVGVQEDLSRSAQWLEMSSIGGNANGQSLLGNMLYNGWGVPRDVEGAKQWFTLAETHPMGPERVEGGYSLNGILSAGDEMIPGLLPPRSRLSIKEGDCGEACLWTLLRAWGHETTEIDINEIGDSPGRGLHTYELHLVLDRFGLEYRDKMGPKPVGYIPLLLWSFLRKSVMGRPPDLEKYRRFIYDNVIVSVRDGIPVILGIKSYPHGNSLHPVDHFILVVGYNEVEDEIVFNSHNERGRVSVSKLLDTSDGYSLVNRYDLTCAIHVPLPEGGSIVSRQNE